MKCTRALNYLVRIVEYFHISALRSFKRVSIFLRWEANVISQLCDETISESAQIHCDYIYVHIGYFSASAQARKQIGISADVYSAQSTRISYTPRGNATLARKCRGENVKQSPTEVE